MKKFATVFITLLLCLAAGAQESSESFYERYQRLVRNLGYDGVGIETLLDKWEALDPRDGRMLEARFRYWLTKSRTSEVVPMDRTVYLGNSPVITLKGPDGSDINYFEENFFDDELFGRADKAIDKAISLHPNDIGYRCARIDALMAYEKEYPDMALAALLEMIQRNSDNGGSWRSGEDDISRDEFQSIVQEYCYFLFKAGEPATLEAFRIVSERMSKLFPDNPEFLCNQGTYWLSAKQNYKKALKLYDKVLKSDPSNRTALTNSIIAARKSGNNKLAGKYQLELAKINSSK